MQFVMVDTSCLSALEAKSVDSVNTKNSTEIIILFTCGSLNLKAYDVIAQLKWRVYKKYVIF